MRIVSCPYAELDEARRQAIEKIVFDEFGAIPIVRETEWAQADFSYRGFIDDRLACFYNLVLREVLMDGSPVKVAGLNNLITLPAFRGNGWGTQLLKSTIDDWFSQFDVECGLLLCADALVPLYSHLGWQRLNSAVTFDQSKGDPSKGDSSKRACTWTANCMIFDREERAEPESLHLNGCPW